MFAKVYLTRKQWDGLRMVHLRVALESTYSTEPMFNSKKRVLRVTEIKTKTIVFEIPNQTLKRYCLQMNGNKTKRKPRAWIRMTPA